MGMSIPSWPRCARNKDFSAGDCAGRGEPAGSPLFLIDTPIKPIGKRANDNGWDAASPCSFAHTSGWNEGKHRSALQPLDNDAAAELSVSEIPDHGKSLHGQMKTV